MNILEADIFRTIESNPCRNQREISKISGYSLGTVNKSVKKLCDKKLIDEMGVITENAKAYISEHKPKNAIILAAGFGMRMVPINTETPKALLNVKGEVLIERHIRHLMEIGVHNIYIVVGFMKESFEYLIDKYNVKLLVNSEYSLKNNMHSLKKAIKYIKDSYIIPCDIWCEMNPYRSYELYSWYMVSEAYDEDSMVRVNRKQELILDTIDCRKMIGIAYVCHNDADKLIHNLVTMCNSSENDDMFWENCLIENDRYYINSRMVSEAFAIEINTYEQLRAIDSNSIQLKSNAISIISKAMKVDEHEITNITVLKRGMTNRSFLFDCKEKRYIMRIPGEGTDKLINRQNEAAVYKEIKDKGICDNIVYINPENGYKITEYIEGARTCDPANESDIKRCMKKLKNFHRLDIKLEHEFNMFEQIDFYEDLWSGNPSAYKDYKKTKEKVLSLKEFIDKHVENKCLTHIDAVPDNFLFDKKDEIKLIDWEYAGMQDPHVDIAMFCIYSLYEREQIDHLIDLYFDFKCPEETRTKIYCYIAVGGLLWSNWCEYKRMFGIEFGEYSLRQYRYAKDYYNIASGRIKCDK